MIWHLDVKAIPRADGQRKAAEAVGLIFGSDASAKRYSMHFDFIGMDGGWVDG